MNLQKRKAREKARKKQHNRAKVRERKQRKLEAIERMIAQQQATQA